MRWTSAFPVSILLCATYVFPSFCGACLAFGLKCANYPTDVPTKGQCRRGGVCPGWLTLALTLRRRPIRVAMVRQQVFRRWNVKGLAAWKKGTR